MPLKFPIYSRTKKPIAAFEHNGTLVLFMRGPRKGSSQYKACFKPSSAASNALAASLYTAKPEYPCNFHPWFSSIVFSVVKEYQVSTTDVKDVSFATECFEKDNVVVCVSQPALADTTLCPLSATANPSRRCANNYAENVRSRALRRHVRRK